jgi:hypothetical protein
MEENRKSITSTPRKLDIIIKKRNLIKNKKQRALKIQKKIR